MDMESKSHPNGENHVGEKREVVADDPLLEEVKLADIIWMKIRGHPWWPAQVVDANTITRSNKPRKRSAEDVLVRLYGSYTYMYVNPIKYRSDFERVLKDNNGCYKQILVKALEQAVPSSKFGESKRQSSRSKVKPDMLIAGDEAHRKSSKKDAVTSMTEGRMRKNMLKDKSTEDVKNKKPKHDKEKTNSPELSVRRLKVMQNLGLIAPPGSPFRKK